MAFNCTLCGIGPRVTAIIVGLLSLIFSFFYIAFTICGILVRNCNIDLSQSPEGYAIYLYYLRNADCGDVNLANLGLDIPSDVRVEVPDISAAGHRTFIFCIAGLALYGAWFVTTIFMLGSACISCMGRCCILVGIYPYIVTLFLVLIFDGVAFVFYFIDFIKTFDLDYVINLLEIQNADIVKPVLREVDDIYLVVPPLFMWLAASKGVLFWFMFLTLGFIMIGVASRLWEENKPATPYSASPQRPQRHNTPSAPVEMADDTRYSTPAARYDDPARQPIHNLPYQEIPPSNANIRRTVEPLKPAHEPVFMEQTPSRTHAAVPPADDIPAPLRVNSSVNPYSDKRFSYLPGNPQPFSYLARPVQVSPSNSTVTPEVRNQLPWSYFAGADDQRAPPRRVTSTLNDRKDFPGQELVAPIVRPNAPDSERSSDDGRWSGPEYKY